MFGFGPIATFLVIAVAALVSGIKILKEYERGVVFRLGRMVGSRGPGIVYIIPGIEKMVRMDLRTVTMDIPPQDVITRDNVSVKVNAVLYFRVLDPNLAVREVENYLFATSQLAQVTLRSVCGQGELDELLAEREKINSRIQDILDQANRSLGHQGGTCRAQAYRSTAGNAARHGQAGRSRARTARQSHPCRG